MIKFFRKNTKAVLLLLTILLIALLTIKIIPFFAPSLPLKKGAHIVLIGNNLGSRMINYGYFETEMHLRYPEFNLFIRNMCDGGNTPGFRPHASRVIFSKFRGIILILFITTPVRSLPNWPYLINFIGLFLSI